MGARVDYFEIGTSDPDGSKAFYGGLFDWAFDSPSPQGYEMVDGGAGGLWDTSASGGAEYAVFYVHVEDVRATYDRAVALGATALMPVVDNGDIEFAHLSDPKGNRFAIWRPKSDG